MSKTRAIGLERFDMLRGQSFERHVHEVHQLAWASRGVLTVDVENHCLVLPPNLALWIPAGTWHARIQAATGHLAEGLPVGRVAELVGYATPSAFVAAFHRVTGHTPTGYFGTQTTTPMADTQHHGE